MGTIASILFGIGVAGSTVLSVMLVCMIGSYHQDKKRVALQVQKKSRLAYWDTYWADRALLGSPPCTASRNAAKAFTAALSEEVAKQDELNVTGEFAEIAKHKIISRSD